MSESIPQFKADPTRVVMVPTRWIRPNPRNPRGQWTKTQLALRLESLRLYGQKTPALLRLRSAGERERENPDIPLEIVDGEGRYWGVKELGLDLKAIIVEMGQDEAVEEGVYASQDQDKFWLNKLMEIEILESRHPGVTKAEIARRLEKDESYVRKAKKVLEILDEYHRLKLSERFRSEADYQPNFRMILELTSLFQKDNPGLNRVNEALDLVLDKQLKRSKVKALVQWILKGEKAADFDAEAAVRAVQDEDEGGEGDNVDGESLEASPDEASLETGRLPGRTLDAASKESSVEEPDAKPDSQGLPDAKAQAPTAGLAQQHPGRHSIGKSLVHDVSKAFHWAWKHFVRMVKGIIRWLWRLVKDAVKELAKSIGKWLGALARALLSLALFVLIVWLLYKALMHWGFHFWNLPGLSHHVQKKK